MIYNCCNEKRKSQVLKNPSSINGIDFLEVLDTRAHNLPDSPPQQTLLVHCLNPLQTSANWSPANVVIDGGESITQISISWVAPATSVPAANANPDELQYFNSLPDKNNVIVVRTSIAGDFSTYCLRLVNNATQAALDPFNVTEVLAGFDPQLAAVDFSFKVECCSNFDCAPPTPNCPPSLPPPPPINYLAKDFGSFRTIILDRLNQLLPTWGGTSEADLGVTLAELMAYVGDYLSYQQDAVATEAYLETARLRVSLRRHALLVDYHVHDGCNARVWMHLKVSAPAGTPVTLDHTQTKFYTTVPGMPASLAGSVNEEAALNAGVQVFEPMQDADLYSEHNCIKFYTWGDTDCCLPQGATEATLDGSFPNLQPGDVLIFEEVIGPQTGDPADADLRHRCAVRLTQVTIQDGQGNPLQDTLFPTGPVPVTEIQWAAADALPFPLCLSSNYIASSGTNTFAPNVSVAYGNTVLADHGLTMSGIPMGTVPQPKLYWPPNPATDRCNPQPASSLPVQFRPTVPDSPLTQAVPLPLAGIPVTPGIVALAGLGYISIPDSTGLASLLIQPANPIDWPLLIGVIVSANSTVPANIDLSVVYVPTSPSGTAAQVALETFTNLSLTSTDPNYVVTQVNALSQLIQIPTSFSPPTTIAAFPTTPTMLTASGIVNLVEPVTVITFLEVQATNPMAWPPLFGVATEINLSNPSITDAFNVLVFYNPPAGGVGVNVPVLVGQFGPFPPTTAAGQHGLVTLMSFEDAPNAGLSATELMTYDPDQAVPVITLDGPGPSGQTNALWTPVQDLLGSSALDTCFVVEVESDGTATLRFGDDTNGFSPISGWSFTANYRIGNGTAGNVGADIIVNLFTSNSQIASCCNPLPAGGGTDPENNDQIRRRAPQAFMTQERAVTMADYADMAEENSQVDRAESSLRWTGSWYTVFVAVEPNGGGQLTKPLAKTLKQYLERYRLAGQDLELDSPQYVSLEITLQVCVDPNYFQGEVEQALQQVLSNRILPNGQKGVFYPDNFTFGQTVYLSPVYAAARSVAGVTSVLATVFQPQGGASTQQYINSGELPLGPLQVARLDNDRNYPDHGQLTLVMKGGKQ